VTHHRLPDSNPSGLELWQQASFIDLVQRNKVSCAHITAFVSKCEGLRLSQAHEFIFCLFGDLPDVFAEVNSVKFHLVAFGCVTNFSSALVPGRAAIL
jgi:hypothetical protein